VEWFEVNVEGVGSLKDAVMNRLFELGAEGINESDGPSGIRIRAFFQKTLKGSVTEQMTLYLQSLREMYPDIQLTIEFRPVPDENWADRYQQFYKAQRLTHLFFLKPRWDQDTIVPDEMIPIVMDAGQAFGTGLHATTKLSIRMIQSAVGLFSEPSRVQMIDVGTGSGILSIAASKLGVEKITAIDIDPIAVGTAQENCTFNGCSNVRILNQEFENLRETFDLIVSNILLDTHLKLVESYRDHLSSNGILILSGILAHQRQELDETFRTHGFIEEFSETLQEWAGIAYTRRETT